MKNMIRWPTTAEFLFAIKSFIAGMLALFLAMRLGLPRPFWSLITAYTVALPLSGAVRSKAIYRMMGTIMGAVVVVLVIPRMVNYPVLLSLVLSLWIAVCLYISQFDRTPRSYIFILAGYTTTIIGFPALINTSLFTFTTIFDAAIARVQEIMLGIVCASVVHGVFFPESVGPLVIRRMDQSLKTAQQWICSALLDRGTTDHRSLAQDITELRLMGIHLPFDTSNLRWVSGAIGSMQDRLSEILPLLSAVEDRVRALYASGNDTLPSNWEKLLADIADWVQQGQEASPETAVQLRSRIDAEAPVISAHSSWEEMLFVNLASELIKLVDACENCFYLRQQIDHAMQGGAIPSNTRRLSRISTLALHTDRRIALMSAITAGSATIVSCAFWVISGWPLAFCAPMLAAISSMLFATLDNPVPAMKVMLRYTLYSSISSGLYIFFFFPMIHSYETFMLVMAPFMIVGGIYMARPATFLPAMALLLSTCATLTLKDMGVSDITTFINSQVSQIFGLVAAIVATQLFRSFNSEWTANRLLRAGWKEIARLCEAVKAPPVIAVTVRMVDRISLLVPRLATAPTHARNQMKATNAIEDLRVGLNVAALLRVQKHLQQHFVSVRPLLNALSTHFKNRSVQSRYQDQSLLKLIDDTLHDVCSASPSMQQREAVSALVGIRRDMFPEVLSCQFAAKSNKEN